MKISKYIHSLWFFVTAIIFNLNAQRSFDTKVDYSTGLRPYSIALGDLNGDGKPDLVVANWGSNTLSVLTNAGNGIFGIKTDYGTGSEPFSIAIGDLNGDGKPDLTVINQSSNTLSVLTNTGNGTFGTKVDYSTGLRPLSIAIGDLNGDGKPDLVVANQNSNNLSVLTNTGNGTFGTKVDYGTSNGPWSIAIGDLNGDGKPDLTVTNFNSNTLSVLTNTGNGTFGIKKDYNTGYNPSSIAIGDLNGDGKPDLTVINQSSNTLSVLTNTGNGTFGTKVDYSTGLRPLSIAIGDLNGDGKPDLVVANQNSNNLSVLTNTGNGTFGTKVDYGTSNGPWSIAIGDLNGDGKADLAVTNIFSNTISVLLAKERQFINGYVVSNKEYGNAFAINATATSGLGVSYISSNPAIVNLSDNSATATGIGVVTLTAYQIGNETFAGVTLTGVFTVTKANLTVSANNFSRVYGTENPVFTSSMVGLVLGNTVNVSYSTTATSLSGVGTYPIHVIVSGGVLPNYNLTTVVGLLSIVPKPATILGFNASKVYGEANPIFSGTVLGLVNHDDVVFSASSAATSLSGVGNYNILVTAIGANIDNYSFSLINSNLSVEPKPATVLGFNASKVYGEANPVFLGTVLGWVNHDDVVFSATSAATSLSGVGNYGVTVTAIGANIDNYSFSLINASLSVEPKPATILGFNASKVYGEALPVLGGTILGVVNNDDVVFSATSAATSLSGVGNYSVTVTAIGANIDNYSFTVNNASLSVEPKPATVLGFNASKVYGEANPVFSGTVLGLVNHDDVVFSASSAATSLSGVGTYPITVTVVGTDLDNYEFTKISAVLSITKANLTITAFNASKFKGDPDPIFTGTVVGLLNNDSLDVSYDYFGDIMCFTSPCYNILIGVAGDDLVNYNVIKMGGYLTINPYPISITGMACSSVCLPGSTLTVLGMYVDKVNKVCFQIPNGTDCISPTTATGSTLLVEIPMNALSGNITFSGTNINSTSYYLDILVSTLKPIDSSLDIYPNPNSGEFYIVVNEPCILLIYNSLGIEVYKNSVVKGINKIQSYLPKGLYTIKVDNTIKKLIVE